MFKVHRNPAEFKLFYRYLYVISFAQQKAAGNLPNCKMFEKFPLLAKPCDLAEQNDTPSVFRLHKIIVECSFHSFHQSKRF